MAIVESLVYHILTTKATIIPPWSLQWPPGARPTNDISIEFEIRPKFGVL